METQMQSPYQPGTIEYQHYRSGFQDGQSCRANRSLKFKDMARFSHNRLYAKGFDDGYRIPRPEK